MSLLGTFCGNVEDNKDFENLGRLKVRVPHVYGAVGGVFGAITTDSIPWALPFGMPAGGSGASGGISMLPEVGDQVLVQFLDGEPEKPVWTWFMQTQKQAKSFQLHEYTDGAPDRAILTRYGHSLELKLNQVVLTTAEGYQVLLSGSQSDTGGSVAIQTPAGQGLSINDLRQTAVLQALDTAAISAGTVVLSATSGALINAARFTVLSGSSSIMLQGNLVTITTGTGATLIIDDQGNIAMTSAGKSSLSLENNLVQLGEATGTGMVLESGKVSLNAPQMVINTSALSVGAGAGSPVFLLTQSALTYFLTHTHTNGNNGSPTGPPIPTNPLFPTDSASQTMQTS